MACGLVGIGLGGFGSITVNGGDGVGIGGVGGFGSVMVNGGVGGLGAVRRGNGSGGRGVGVAGVGMMTRVGEGGLIWTLGGGTIVGRGGVAYNSVRPVFLL